MKKIVTLLLGIVLTGAWTLSAQETLYIYKSGIVDKSIAQADFDSAKVESTALKFYKADAVIYNDVLAEIDSITFIETAIPFELTAPAAAFDLLLSYENSAEAAVKFEWNTELPAGSKLVLSKTEDFTSGTIEIEVSGTDKAFTHAQLQAIIENADNGLKRYKKNLLYWNIKQENEWASATPRSIMLSGQRVLVDARDPQNIEIYPVAVVDEEGYQGIWLAEDLRATKYADDGTDVGELSICYHPDGSSPEVGHPANRAKRSVYYNYDWDTPLFDGEWGNPWELTFTKLKRLAPTGWKLPTYQEWLALFTAARETPDGDKVVRDPVIYQDESYGAWGVNLAPAGESWGSGSGMGFWWGGNVELDYLFDSGSSGEIEYIHTHGANNIGAFTRVFVYHPNETNIYRVRNGANVMRLKYTGDDE